MNETKCTPGPWVAQGDMVLADDDQMMVADARGWSYLTKIKRLKDEEAVKVMHANARLIADAPAMFDLIVRMQNAILAVASATCGSYQEMRKVLDDTHAMIRKHTVEDDLSSQKGE